MPGKHARSRPTMEDQRPLVACRNGRMGPINDRWSSKIRPSWKAELDHANSEAAESGLRACLNAAKEDINREDRGKPRHSSKKKSIKPMPRFEEKIDEENAAVRRETRQDCCRERRQLGSFPPRMLPVHCIPHAAKSGFPLGRLRAYRAVAGHQCGGCPMQGLAGTTDGI